MSSFGLGVFSPAAALPDLTAAQPAQLEQTSGTLDLEALRVGSLDGWAEPEPQPEPEPAAATATATGAAAAVDPAGAGGAAPPPAPEPAPSPADPGLPDCSGGGPC